MTPTQSTLAQQIAERLLARNRIFEDFFSQEAPKLAAVSREMAERFLRGGRLLAFGRGACATDAQHVSVEFVHPVIVGKRALPALDLSAEFAPWLDALVRPEDIVMGFAPPEGDCEVQAALDAARARNAMTLALSGASGSYWFPAVTDDAFINQELIEVLYHTLWETVHVFLEHRELGQDAGRRWVSLSFPRAQQARRRITRKGSGRIHPHEGSRRCPSARLRLPKSNPNRSLRPRWPSTNACGAAVS